MKMIFSLHRADSAMAERKKLKMTTAVCTIREVFPDASISTYRRTSDEDVALGTPNPEVVITDQHQTVLWSSKQKNLYQKYPKKRKESMSQIRKACEA